MDPLNEWVVDRHESHILRRRRPTERAQKRASSARKKKKIIKTAKRNNRRACVCIASIAVEHRYNNKRNRAAAAATITSYLSRPSLIRDSPRSIATPPRRRCFLFHFNLLFSLSARLLRERSFESNSSSRGENEASEQLGMTLHLFGV